MKKILLTVLMIMALTLNAYALTQEQHKQQQEQRLMKSGKHQGTQLCLIIF